MNRHEEWNNDDEETPLFVPSIDRPAEQEPGNVVHHRRVQSHDDANNNSSNNNNAAAGSKQPLRHHHHHRGGNRHRRNMTSIRDLFRSGRMVLESVGENMASEGRLVRQSFLDKLQEADEGKLYFFDMSLTRTLSVIPDQFPEIVQQVTGQQKSQDQQQEASTETTKTTAETTAPKGGSTDEKKTTSSEEAKTQTAAKEAKNRQHAGTQRDFSNAATGFENAKGLALLFRWRPVARHANHGAPEQQGNRDTPNRVDEQTDLVTREGRKPEPPDAGCEQRDRYESSR